MELEGHAVFGCFCAFTLSGSSQDLLEPACALSEVQGSGNAEQDSKRLLAKSEKMWCCQDVQVLLCEQDCGCHTSAAPCSASFTLFTQSLSQVQRHLSKLFDNLAKLKFQVDSEQKITKVGLGMYSREEEYVQFSEPCDCSGQVRGDTLSVQRAPNWDLLPHPWVGIPGQDPVELHCLCEKSWKR